VNFCTILGQGLRKNWSTFDVKLSRSVLELHARVRTCRVGRAAWVLPRIRLLHTQMIAGQFRGALVLNGLQSQRMKILSGTFLKAQTLKRLMFVSLGLQTHSGGDLVQGLEGTGSSAEKFFCRPPPANCEIWRGRRGTHCLLEVNVSSL